MGQKKEIVGKNGVKEEDITIHKSGGWNEDSRVAENRKQITG